MHLFSTHPPLEERIARLRGTSTSTPAASHRKETAQDGARSFWDQLSK
jgi:heat shock protein HtpX